MKCSRKFNFDMYFHSKRTFLAWNSQSFKAWRLYLKTKVLNWTILHQQCWKLKPIQILVYVAGAKDDSLIMYSYTSFICEIQRLQSIRTTCNGKKISKKMPVSSAYLSLRTNLCGMKAFDIWFRRAGHIWPDRVASEFTQRKMTLEDFRLNPDKNIYFGSNINRL